MSDKTLNGKSLSISLRDCESACWYSWSSKGTCTDLTISKLKMDRLHGNQGHGQFLGKRPRTSVMKLISENRLRT